jgi:hypothetical protein
MKEQMMLYNISVVHQKQQDSDAIDSGRQDTVIYNHADVHSCLISTVRVKEAPYIKRKVATSSVEAQDVPSARTFQSKEWKLLVSPEDLSE